LFLKDVFKLMILLVDQHLFQAFLFEVLDAHGQFRESIIDLTFFEHVCCRHELG
jgi:hypothetical protein